MYDLYRKNKNTSLQTASQVPTVTNNQTVKNCHANDKKVSYTQQPTTSTQHIFITNPTLQKGLSRRPLKNGCLGFSLLTPTHDDIAFAVNPLSPPHFCR